MTCSEIWQNFEKFPQIFREIVQKFNIIQYYSIVSLDKVDPERKGNADGRAGRGPLDAALWIGSFTSLNSE